MDRRPVFPLLAAVLLAGCAWGGEAAENADGAQPPANGAVDPYGRIDTPTAGPRLLVPVENRAASTVDARIAAEDQASSVLLTAAPGATEERELLLERGGPVLVTLAYTLRGASSSSGEQETTADPDECSGTWRVLFLVEESEGATVVSAHGRCVRA